MKKICFVCALLFSFQALAQSSLMNQLDSSVRNSGNGSMMFAQPESQNEEQMRAREQRAYEEQMRAQQEAMMRAEQERKAALRPVNLFGNTLKIYAIINGEVMTSRDMQERANAFVATTQIPITPQNRKIVLDRVLQGAIDERIKIQEAQKNGITISNKEINAGVLEFAKSNGISIEQLNAMLQEAGVSGKVFKEQIKAEIAWARLIQRKAAQSSKISRGEIQKAIDAYSKDKQKQKFLVSEIVLPRKKAEYIDELVEVLREDPRFSLYAMQFSQSPTAKRGGNLGWVSNDQLPEKLSSALKKMKAGQISNPIAYGTDYYILKLEQIYTPGVNKMPVPSEKEMRLLLENKKLEEIAGKYLRDLRNKAVVERKS
ncbi:MAG: peptidylprolyl isomerase [Alphaproteobacteria bacterium]|nr:peptidylprolyl isomerase [Alphaproteobacteria bacterium]